MDKEPNVFKFFLSKMHDNVDDPIGISRRSKDNDDINDNENDDILAKAVAVEEITINPRDVLKSLFGLCVTNKKGGVHCDPIKRPGGLYYIDQLVNLWRYFYNCIEDKMDASVETETFVILGRLIGYIINDKIMEKNLYWFNGYDSRK